MLTLRRTPPIEQATHAGRGGRPVLLATIDAPFDEDAAIFAVESALECGQPLIVANVREIPLGPLCVAMGYGTLEPSEEDAANLRAPAELAQSFGVTLERLRVLSPHPIDALLQLVSVGWLHVFCVASGLFGAVLLGSLFRRRQKRSGLPLSTGGT